MSDASNEPRRSVPSILRIRSAFLAIYLIEKLKESGVELDDGTADQLEDAAVEQFAKSQAGRTITTIGARDTALAGCLIEHLRRAHVPVSAQCEAALYGAAVGFARTPVGVYLHQELRNADKFSLGF